MRIGLESAARRSWDPPVSSIVSHPFQRFLEGTSCYRWARPNDVASSASTQLFIKGCRPVYWRLALLILLTTGGPQAKAEPPDEQALRLLNHYRQIAGLTPVRLERQLSAGCMEHADYMVQNQGTDAMAGLNPHTQRSNLPGASAAGAAWAKAADLFLGVSDLAVAIDVWMSGMYHRR